MEKTIQEAIQEIYDLHGKVTPSLVVNAARDVSSPLHARFEWDVDKAANQYLLIQARKLIRTVRVIYEDKEDKLVHVSNVDMDKDTNEGEYKPIGAIVKQPSEFERALSEAMRRLGAARQAVDDLKQAVDKSEDDSIAKLAIALESINTAREIVKTIH